MVRRRGAMLPLADDSRRLLLLLSARVAQLSGWFRQPVLRGCPGAFIRVGSTVTSARYGVCGTERVESRRT